MGAAPRRLENTRVMGEERGEERGREECEYEWRWSEC